MNLDSLTHDCERQDELISVLYGEAQEEEIRDFQTHLQQCPTCKEQYESFGAVRTSVREFRDQALLGFQPVSISAPVQQKSAIAALKAFFDLSPLWLKVGTALAAAILIAFASLSLVRTQRPKVEYITKSTPIVEGKTYTEAQLKEAIAKALNEASIPSKEGPTEVKTAQNSNDQLNTYKKPSQLTQSRRPLSRNERQQLAADLRLVVGPEDDDLELLSDRINR